MVRVNNKGIFWIGLLLAGALMLGNADVQRMGQVMAMVMPF